MVGLTSGRERKTAICSVRPVAVDGAAAHDSLSPRFGGATWRGGPRRGCPPPCTSPRAACVGINRSGGVTAAFDLLDERSAFLVIHAYDVLGMGAQKDRLAPCLGRGAHDRMRDRRD